MNHTICLIKNNKTVVRVEIGQMNINDALEVVKDVSWKYGFTPQDKTILGSIKGLYYKAKRKITNEYN